MAAEPFKMVNDGKLMLISFNEKKSPVQPNRTVEAKKVWFNIYFKATIGFHQKVALKKS